MDTTVLIVGAGPTGLTLACDLARRGIAHRIVDRDPGTFAGSRGKGIQPRTLEVFADLGVIDKVLEYGGPYPPMRGYQGRTVRWERLLAERQLVRSDVPYPNPLMLPQWRTTQILRERLAEFGVQVQTGSEVTEITQDADGVTALVAGERVRARYLVGADGGRSAVRKAVGVNFLGRTLEDVRMTIADVKVAGLDRDHWHMWQSDRYGMFALCPLAGTDTFQLATGPMADITEAALQTILTEVSERDDLVLSDVSWTSTWRANVRMVDRYRVERVFLAGDAAHVHTPAGGQGLNTGVQDAYNLGWKLAVGTEEILDSYQDERLPVAAGVLGVSSELFTRRTMDRNDVSLRQLGVHYRDSKLSVDLRPSPGSLRAGDRAPDGLTGDRRIHRVLAGPQFTVLAFGSARYEGAYPVTDAPAYDIDGDMLAAVRPDGYLGMISDDPAEIRRYLESHRPAGA